MSPRISDTQPLLTQHRVFKGRVNIFDWDGTLANSIDLIVRSIQSAAAHYQQPVPEPQAIKDIIGLSIDKAMNTLFPGVEGELKNNMAHHYSQKFFAQPLTRDDLFPGVYEMLEQLKQSGYRLAVATGKKAEGLGKAIAQTEVGHLFDSLRCADQTASKPDPLMLEQIMAELGVNKQRTLMVGDSIHDLQMALNADVASVGVTCGAHSAEILQAYQPLRCLAYPTDLLKYF